MTKTKGFEPKHVLLQRCCFALIGITTELDDKWASKTRNRTVSRHSRHGPFIWLWFGLCIFMIIVTWIFLKHHRPVNNVVRLPYYLISGAWWSKRATRPKKHVPGGINSTQIRGDCGIWSFWSCVLAFQHQGSLRMAVATGLKTRKSVDWGCFCVFMSSWLSTYDFDRAQIHRMYIMEIGETIVRMPPPRKGRQLPRYRLVWVSRFKGD